MCGKNQEIRFLYLDIYVFLFPYHYNIKYYFILIKFIFEMANSITAPVELDDLDRRILRQMQIDSSLTNQELARRIHASPPTCLRRVRRLINTGIIDKQVAILDPKKLGPALTAIVEITLDIQTAEHLEQFETIVAKEDAILQCYRVSTGPDFVVIAQVTDMPAYHAMAHRVFTSHANLRNVRTFFSIYRSKFETLTVIAPRS